jgi:bis(5'-nucleosidyl)-tetraphosphatase
MKMPQHDESFGIVPVKQEEGEWKFLLILHKGGHHWGFPKGHGNPGESSQEAARRELKEETGLDIVRFLQESPFVEKYQFSKRGELVEKQVSYFPAIVSGNLQLQVEEIRDAKWLPFQEALAQLSFEEARQICRHVMKILQAL